MPFNFEKLSIPEVVLIEPMVYHDDRGCFLETYKYSDFADAGIKEHFVQDNHSKSEAGVLRGLHFQKAPSAQGKLVRCLRGKIFDVAVDIRKGSKTFKRWVAEELTEENERMLYIPAGFAHGFLVLSDRTEIMYKCTKEYSPEDERGVIWNDPDIGIDWPMKVPLLSEKDKRYPVLREIEL